MQRITTVLKSSAAMTARKAVCMAGAERVVILGFGELGRSSTGGMTWQWPPTLALDGCDLL